MKDKPAKKWYRRLINAMVGVITLILLCHENTLRADRTTAESYVYNGNVSYLNANDYRTAENLFYIAITNDPAWALPYNNRGLARFHQGNFSGADADFEAAKGADTNYVSPYLNKGKSLAAQKRFSEAVTELRAGLAVNSNNAALYFNLGWVYDELGLYTNAISNYTAAVSIKPDYPRALLGRGVSYAKMGDTNNAITDFYAAINHALPKQGDNMVADMAAYDLQLTRGPGVPFVSNNAISNYADGLFRFSTEQYDAAVSSLRLAQTTDPNVPDIPWMIAWSYLKDRQPAFGSNWMVRACALMETEVFNTLRGGETVFVDGIKKGIAPCTVHLFRSRYDVSVCKTTVPLQEWVGPLYTDGTEGGSGVMLVNPTNVSAFTGPGPIADTDRDWLADSWETAKFGNLASTPEGDEDRDGLPNLYEFWLSSDPNKADTDGDGVSDLQEYMDGSDPADPGSHFGGPQSQTAEVGNTVMFNSGASGLLAASYQWYFNNTAVGGGTSDRLSLPSVQVSQSGSYSVVIYHSGGVIISAPAMLNVIPAVPRTNVMGIAVSGEIGSLVNVEHADLLAPTPAWVPLSSVTLTSAPQYCFDPVYPLPQRYYRAWQSGSPSVRSVLDPRVTPAITVTGTPGTSVRVDGINAVGPIDAWFTLATIAMTNTTQLYFDVSAQGQPKRLYRLVPLP